MGSHVHQMQGNELAGGNTDPTFTGLPECYQVSSTGIYRCMDCKGQEKEQNKEDISNIYKVFEQFRSQIQADNAQSPQKAVVSHGAFAIPTFRDQKLDEKESKNGKDKRPDKKCLCEKIHWLRVC